MKLQWRSGSPIQLIRPVHARGTMRSIAFAMVLVGSTAGCDVNSALEQVSEGRRLSADLLVQFTKAADTSNRAVMADSPFSKALSSRTKPAYSSASGQLLRLSDPTRA